MKRLIYIALPLSIVLNFFLIGFLIKPQKAIDFKLDVKKSLGKGTYLVDAKNPLLIYIKSQISKEQSTTQIIDSVRSFVYNNTVHNEMSEEFRMYGFVPDTSLARMVRFHQNKGSRPHLSCSPRSWLMRRILNSYGIKNRIIQSYFVSGDSNLYSHTFIEVLDEELDKWVVHDPDLNITYATKDSMGTIFSYLSFEQMKKNALAGRVNYPKKGTKLNLGLSIVDFNAVRNLSAYAYRYQKEAYQKDLVFIDRTNFNITQKFKNNNYQTIEEILGSEVRIIEQ